MSILDLDDEDILGLNTSTAKITIPDVTAMDTTEAALAYAAAGIYVLPVRFKSKSPGSRVGDRWQDKSVIDRQDVMAHWGGTNDGIALHAGRSGLVIFDVDHPEELPDVLARAIDECQPPYQQSRPDTPGRGHFVFAQPPGRTIGNGPGKLGDAWGQVRGLNGVIIAEPTPHKHADDGAEYEWRRVGPVPVLPNYVADDLPDGSQAEDAATDAVVKDFLEAHTGNDRPDLLDRFCHTFTKKTGGGGSRHMAAVSLLVGALKEARAGYYDARTADARLRGLFHDAVTDTDVPNARTERQAATEWAGIRSWAVGQAIASDPAKTVARVKDKVPPNPEIIDLSEFTTTSTPPPPGVDAETGETTGGGTEPPPTPPRNPGNVAAERLSTSLLAFDSEFWSIDFEAEDFLVEPILARGRGHLVYAPAKAGKSLFALYVAACAATGRRVLDQPAGDPIRVMYVDLEMTRADVRERLGDMAFSAADDLSNLIYYSFPSLAMLDTAQGGAELVALAVHHGVDLVVIDTISKAVHGEENANDTAQAFARFTGTPLKAAGITLLRVDHAGKDLERGARGGSAKVDDVDVVWQLIPRDRGRFTLKATHRRINWVPEAVELEQTTEPLAYRTSDSSWPAGTKAASDLLDRLGVPTEHGKGRARKALAAAGGSLGNEVLMAAIRFRRSNPVQVVEVTP